MVNYKEILRLAAEGTSQRQIAASVRSSRNKVNEVILAAKAANIAWAPEESITNEQLGAMTGRLGNLKGVQVKSALASPKNQNN